MTKIFIIGLTTLLISSFYIFQSSVYICKGPSSKVYHKSAYCRGLSNCSTKIYQVTLDEAKKLGRRECKIEF
jgi:hypothetical protein